MSDPSGTTLDISALVNAIARLGEGLDRHRKEPHDEQLRDGMIQRFEYTLSHRMRRRYLRLVAPSPDIYDQMPFQDLVRTGNEQGLLRANWSAWRRYSDMRARTSHTYAAAVAEQVAAGIPDFLTEATYLRDQLQQRLR
jgi:nucleotidyltransferase substrate binding protein (TIGR01987 family)